MPAIKDERRRGRENQDIQRKALNDALKNWKKAPPAEKPKWALSILAHIGAMGSTLKECVPDPKTAQEIRNDARRGRH
ncbi:MAG: hypothetical protein HYS74_00380 [Parcubacteria group bacterium]|nr:hypothetical protein [Parcubacteria group bacterium]